MLLGHTVSELGYTIFGQPFLGSSDNAGFLYIKPSFQVCFEIESLGSETFFSSKCISNKEKNWRDVKNEALNGIWCCNIFSLGYTWEHKTQLNIQGMITYGNISFLLSQTQLAKNHSELKHKCFFFKVHFNYFLTKKPKLCFNSLSGEGSIY